jgi:predicted CXXCH cytochrome family protein
MKMIGKSFSPSIIAWLFLVLILMFPGLLLAQTVIDGTAHQFEYGSIEPDSFCGSICHTFLEGDVFLSEVERAWMTSLNRFATVGTVAAMCSQCHRSDGAYSSTMYDAFSDDNVYHPDSHGQKMYINDPPPGTSLQASGLPDIWFSSGHFECSTCHDSHDDSMRPFLRESMNGLCARCHGKRQYVQGIETTGALVVNGSWDPAIFGGFANPGSHPVGEDVQPGRPGAPPVLIDARFRVPHVGTPRAWSPGPHLSEGIQGGVVCVTCHAVHGTDPDPDAMETTATQVPPAPSFLAVAQSLGQVVGYARALPNGQGDYNTLCESCHGVGGNPAIAPGGTPWEDGEHNVNPGSTGSFSHPTDTYPSTLANLASSPPEGWPVGNSGMAGPNLAFALICETCHQPHPLAAVDSGRVDVMPGAGAYILRAPLQKGLGSETLCDVCHPNQIEGHHPIMKPFDGLGAEYMVNVISGPDNMLTCSTCHTTAHNWTQPGWAGLDPGWKPIDNGRSLLQAEDMYNPDMSKSCMDCHYFMDGDVASVSPTRGSLQTVITSSDAEFEHYQIAEFSMGTHYIGVIHEDDKERWQGVPLVDIFDVSLTWRQQSPDSDFDEGLAEGWSRFGGDNSSGNRVLVCESCHELEPEKNGRFAHLLLAPYRDGQNGIDEYPGDEDGRDVLCEACHGRPSGSHPMTGDIVTGTDQPLDTSAEWMREVIYGYATLDRDTVSLSCDACHQPHDANSNSFTYCLDVPDVTDIPGYTGRGVGSATLITGYGELGGNPGGYQEFNGDPGTYVTPRAKPVPHHGLCLQCHDK